MQKRTVHKRSARLKRGAAQSESDNYDWFLQHKSYPKKQCDRNIEVVSKFGNRGAKKIDSGDAKGMDLCPTKNRTDRSYLTYPSYPKMAYQRLLLGSSLALNEFVTFEHLDELCAIAFGVSSTSTIGESFDRA
jgi:hypothetical protein